MMLPNQAIGTPRLGVFLLEDDLSYHDLANCNRDLGLFKALPLIRDVRDGSHAAFLNDRFLVDSGVSFELRNSIYIVEKMT